jgi:hypothetical protein
VHQIVNDFATVSCGTTLTIDCPGSVGCSGDVPTEIGLSGFLRFKYGPITAGDVGRALPLFTTPRGSVFTAQVGLPLAGQVWFGAISDARTTDCIDPDYHDQTSSQGVAHVNIVTGGVSVTTSCVTNSSPMNDGLVMFGGMVCNAADHTYTNFTVSASVNGATITYSNQTSLGNPFPVTGGGRLGPGECVSYTGSFVPTGGRCGPFPNQVTACATCVSSYPKTACATSSATCIWPKSESGTIFSSTLEGTNFVFSFVTETNRTYIVQVTDSLSPTNWQNLTNLQGDCSVVTVRDSVTNAHRFYRVLSQ